MCAELRSTSRLKTARSFIKKKISKDSTNTAEEAHEKEKSTKLGPGISCWIETYTKKAEMSIIYRTKDKVILVKIDTHEGPYTFCQFISGLRSLFFFFLN